MGIRAFKPTSAGRRFYTVRDFSEITTSAPLKSLIEAQSSTGGRNHYGRITSRFRGGGHKQRYRVIDFRRDKIGVPAKVADIRPGNCMPVGEIPAGTMIHNLEMKKGRGGQLVRSAGGAAQLMAKDGD